MNIYDSVPASYVEPGDFICVDGEEIEVRTVSDEGDSIHIWGFSFDEGDHITMILDPDQEVDLWTA